MDEDRFLLQSQNYIKWFWKNVFDIDRPLRFYICLHEILILDVVGDLPYLFKSSHYLHFGWEGIKCFINLLIKLPWFISIISFGTCSCLFPCRINTQFACLFLELIKYRYIVKSLIRTHALQSKFRASPDLEARFLIDIRQSWHTPVISTFSSIQHALIWKSRWNEYTLSITFRLCYIQPPNILSPLWVEVLEYVILIFFERSEPIIVSRDNILDVVQTHRNIFSLRLSLNALKISIGKKVWMSVDLGGHHDCEVAAFELLRIAEFEAKYTLIFGDDIHGYVSSNWNDNFQNVTKWHWTWVVYLLSIFAFSIFDESDSVVTYDESTKDRVAVVASSAISTFSSHIIAYIDFFRGLQSILVHIVLTFQGLIHILGRLILWLTIDVVILDHHFVGSIRSTSCNSRWLSK